MAGVLWRTAGALMEPKFAQPIKILPFSFSSLAQSRSRFCLTLPSPTPKMANIPKQAAAAVPCSVLTML